jgi:hypothetical protein
MDGQEIAGHGGGGEHAFEAGDDEAFIGAGPVLGDEIDDGLHGIIAGDDFGEMIDGPDLGIVLDTGDVLIGRDFVYRERGGIAEELTGGGEVFPEGHADFTAASGGKFVELRGGFDDAALAERGEFSGALDGVFFEFSGDDDVCNCGLWHMSGELMVDGWGVDCVNGQALMVDGYLS